MSTDPKIREAIKIAVSDSGQPDGLARKLDSWFEAIATGNEKITDKQVTENRLEMLYEEVKLDTDATDDEVEPS